MRSALRVLFVGLLMLAACGKTNNGQSPAPTAQKLDGFWKVTSVTTGEAKVQKNIDYTRLVHFQGGKIRNFDESEKNTAWTDEKNFSVTGNDVIPTESKEDLHLHVTFNGDEATFVPMNKNGEAEPNEGEHKVVAKRITLEEANRLIDAAKLKITKDEKMPGGIDAFAP